MTEDDIGDVELSTEQTVAEIAEECNVDAESLLDYIAEGIVEAHESSGLEVLEAALGTEELG